MEEASKSTTHKSGDVVTCGGSNHKCIAFGCKVYGSRDGVSMFRFPKDHPRSNKWMLLLGRKDKIYTSPDSRYKRYRVCEHHFATSMFVGPFTNRLLPSALPLQVKDPVNTANAPLPVTDFSIPSTSHHTASCQSTSGHNISAHFASTHPASTRLTSSHSTSTHPTSAHPISAQLTAGSSSYCDRQTVPSSSLVRKRTFSLSMGLDFDSECAVNFIEPRSVGLIESLETVESSVQTSQENPPAMESCAIQTSQRLRKGTPMKIAQKRQIKSLNVMLKRARRTTVPKLSKLQMVECLKSSCTPELHMLLKSQVVGNSCDQRGRRYSTEEKVFSVSAHHYGPAAYRFLQPRLGLPSERTLNRFYADFALPPGDCLTVPTMLKPKVDLKSNLDKLCMICFDEIALKTQVQYSRSEDRVLGLEDYGEISNRNKDVANHALLFMVCGVVSPWKQILAYALCSGGAPMLDVKQMLLQCLRNCFDIGLIPVAVVSDMGSNFQFLAKDLGVSEEKPFFVDSIVGKVFYIFDMCHLVKCLRNTLLSYNLVYPKVNDDNTDYLVSWKHIELLYDSMKTNPFPNAPKITNDHVHVTNKMKVKLAMQVFSNSTAAALENNIAFGGLTNEAAGTADFVGRMDKLIDVLNSSKQYADKPHLCAIKQGSIHVKFLEDALEWIGTWRFFNTRTNKSPHLPSIRGWKITIRATILLWDRLSGVFSLPYLCTRHLTSDAVENQFSTYRFKGGNCSNPTSGRFSQFTKKFIVHRILGSSVTGNCEPDVLRSILDPQTVKQLPCNVNKPTCSVPQPSSSFDQDDIDDPASDTPAALNNPFEEWMFAKRSDIVFQSSFVYCCGFVLKTALRVHKCQDGLCSALNVAAEGVNDATKFFTYLKNYSNSSDFGRLHIPSEEVVNFFNLCSSVVNEEFKMSYNVPGIKQRILNTIFATVDIVFKCPEFPVMSTLDLFVRMRLFYIVKFANQRIRESKQNDRRRLKLSSICNL